MNPLLPRGHIFANEIHEFTNSPFKGKLNNDNVYDIYGTTNTYRTIYLYIMMMILQRDYKETQQNINKRI